MPPAATTTTTTTTTTVAEEYNSWRWRSQAGAAPGLGRQTRGLIVLAAALLFQRSLGLVLP